MNVYQDIDGDVWFQREDGMVTALTDCGVVIGDGPVEWRPFDVTVRNFGPLVRLVKEESNG